MLMTSNKMDKRDGLPGMASAVRCQRKEDNPENLAWREFRVVEFRRKELLEVEADPEVQGRLEERMRSW
jgi:hypothetical protein